MSDMRPLYSVSQVAKMIGVTPAAIRRMIRCGHLESVRIGKKFYVTLAGLQASITLWESIKLHGGEKK